MTIYMIRAVGVKEMLTASKAVAEYCVDFYKKRDVPCEVREYDVKTQGKNFNDLAMCEKTWQ